MNRLDSFPRFLLGKARYARERGITRFKLTHANGDLLFVILGDEGKVTVHRFARAPGPLDQMKMRLETTEDQLQNDVLQGITSHTALDWRG